MKKIFLLTIMCLLFVGCGKSNEEDILKNYQKKLDNSKSYTLDAKMEIFSNEESYNYDVNVTYKEGDFYKVSLINTENSHEQIILKNEDGVYVITPALNKSFKFQSEWPYNSSQSYILSSVIKDLSADSDRTYEEKNDKYIYTSKVDYPNNSSLVKQKVTFNKDMEIQKIEVLDSKDKSQIIVDIIKVDYKTNPDKEYFALENNIDDECCEDENVSQSIEDVVYPMYLPANTVYEGEEKLNNNEQERVILTFSGEKPFILVEETTSVSKEFEVNQTGAELVFYENIVGNLTDTSLSWHENGIDYYIVGQNLSSEELLQIASSTTTVAITK
ncbi:MAG: outer membrane lipoprotein carrier protein LolA [Bacilli bacterium]|nr:outer membrane lipoprotein carrier protein LolA [Bacilli bacterium]